MPRTLITHETIQCRACGSARGSINRYFLEHLWGISPDLMDKFPLCDSCWGYVSRKHRSSGVTTEHVNKWLANRIERMAKFGVSVKCEALTSYGTQCKSNATNKVNGRNVCRTHIARKHNQYSEPQEPEELVIAGAMLLLASQSKSFRKAIDIIRKMDGSIVER